MRLRKRALRALLVCLLCALMGACGWFRYEDQLRTHVELMERIAADAADGMRAEGYRLKPADLQTMAYPLERAGDFIESWKPARSGDAGMARFEEFVNAYAELYRYMDETRTLEDDPAGGGRLTELVGAVSSSASAVTKALGD